MLRVWVITATIATVLLELGSAEARPGAKAYGPDKRLGLSDAACQQMVIWYWYTRSGKEMEYLRHHDVTEPAPEPVSPAIINSELRKAWVKVRYVAYKAAYDPQTKRLLPVHWSWIIDSIRAGRPVIYFSDICPGRPDGKTHAFVLTGYDGAKHLFYANDTYLRRIPIVEEKTGRLVWSKEKMEPMNLQVLGGESNPIWLTPENLDKHKRPNKSGWLFLYSPVSHRK